MGLHILFKISLFKPRSSFRIRDVLFYSVETENSAAVFFLWFWLQNSTLCIITVNMHSEIFEEYPKKDLMQVTALLCFYYPFQALRPSVP